MVRPQAPADFWFWLHPVACSEASRFRCALRVPGLGDDFRAELIQGVAVGAELMNLPAATGDESIWESSGLR